MRKFISLLTFSAALFAGCSDSSSTAAEQYPANAEWRTYCLDVINDYRATEDLPALVLADDEAQKCTDKEAAADLSSNKAHGNFGKCGEYAQNSGPNIDLSWQNTEEKIIDTYTKMMWDEKKLVESGERDPSKSEDYLAIGHYLNMSSTSYKKVSCGIAKNSDGTKGWLNINFY